MKKYCISTNYTSHVRKRNNKCIYLQAFNKSSAHIFTKVGEEITFFQWNVLIRAHSELLETCKHTLYFFEIHFKLVRTEIMAVTEDYCLLRCDTL